MTEKGVMKTAHDSRSVLMERDARPVNEMLRADVLADRRAAEEAGADGEARREIGFEPGSSLTAGRVDYHAVGFYARGEIKDGLRIVGVDRRRMSGARKAQHGPRHLNRLLLRDRNEHRENWAELLFRQRLVYADELDRRYQHSDFCRYLEASLISYPGRIAADRLDVKAAFVEQISADRLDFFRRANMTSELAAVLS